MHAILLAAALSAHAAPYMDSNRLNKDEEAISWTLSAASHCPAIDKEGRWLDGTCVQLVTKVAGTLLRRFVPDSGDVVKALVEIVRCERGPKSAGGTQPFLAQCVQRKSEVAASSASKWKELRAKSPDIPNEVPDAPMPQGGAIFH